MVFATVYNAIVQLNSIKGCDKSHGDAAVDVGLDGLSLDASIRRYFPWLEARLYSTVAQLAKSVARWKL